MGRVLQRSYILLGVLKLVDIPSSWTYPAGLNRHPLAAEAYLDSRIPPVYIWISIWGSIT